MEGFFACILFALIFSYVVYMAIDKPNFDEVKENESVDKK